MFKISKKTAADEMVQFDNVLDEVRPDVAEENRIADWFFINDLRKLKELRSFLLNEAINVSPQDSAPRSFGRLNLLKFDPNGRQPTIDEWSDVEMHTQAMFKLMTEPLRRRFLLGQIPFGVSLLPVIFGGGAVLALIAAIVFQNYVFSNKESLGIVTLPFYLMWLISLGAMGSVAFIGMNALSVQQDATFDIGNQRLMILRITLGALFGLVLTLPFGFGTFFDFVRQISDGVNVTMSAEKISNQALLLLLPFILGFSTTVVILVLNRLVDAIQTFFGKTAATTSAGRPVQLERRATAMGRRPSASCERP